MNRATYEKITMLLSIAITVSCTTCCVGQEASVAFAEDIRRQFQGAFDSQDSSAVSNILAEDFSSSGHSGSVAKLVFSAIFQQMKLGSKLSVESASTKGGQATIVLKADRKKHSEESKAHKFVLKFNNEKKLSSLEVSNATVSAVRVKDELHLNFSEQGSMPFKNVKGLMMVAGKVDGKKGLFIVDSGAPQLFLNKQHFTTAQTGTSKMRGVNGKIDPPGLVDVETLAVGCVTLAKPSRLLCIDKSAIETELEHEVLGLIGYNELAPYVVTLDYQNRTISFAKNPNSEGKDDKAATPIEWHGYEMKGHLPVIECIVGDERFRFCLDTGASANLITPSAFKRLPAASRKSLGSNNLVGADGNESRVDKYEVKNLETLGQSCRPMEFVVSEFPSTKGSEEIAIDGLIGAQWLKQQVVSIDFPNHRIGFNKMEAEPDNSR